MGQGRKIAIVDLGDVGLPIAVAHDDNMRGTWSFVTDLLASGEGIVLDHDATLDRVRAPVGVELWRL